jgi:outer membrane murein-binding lipoprotein Lpp
MEQGNPAVTNQPAQTPAGGAPSAGAAGQVQGTPQATQPQTPQEIRDQIRDQIRRDIQAGREPTINIPDRIDMRDAVPQGAVDVSIAFFVCIAAVIIFRPIVGALVRRSDARNAQLASGAADLRPHIEQLQQSVDAMAIELERITEAQRFQSKLLAERARQPERLER